MFVTLKHMLWCRAVVTLNSAEFVATGTVRMKHALSELIDRCFAHRSAPPFDVQARSIRHGFITQVTWDPKFHSYKRALIVSCDATAAMQPHM